MQRIEKDKLLVDIKELERITGYGRRRAMKLGEMANARVYIGNSVRYNVDKIREFLYEEAI